MWLSCHSKSSRLVRITRGRTTEHHSSAWIIPLKVEYCAFWGHQEKKSWVKSIYYRHTILFISAVCRNSDWYGQVSYTVICVIVKITEIWKGAMVYIALSNTVIQLENWQYYLKKKKSTLWHDLELAQTVSSLSWTQP